jgi:nucleosome binding factor SPN SPT16 subunit
MMVVFRYALLLIDTVLIKEDTAVLLTDCNKAVNDISYFFKVS